ncbi:MAG TPA: type II toxin-antitoxin system RelE/ParE family toxin [Bacteroidales bacterium]|jgi:plasmid stabilization system protein ParE|nr:type II toxin-antitoxin system RelE/ParE family toxin [Bacteroidota bacterium]HHU27045.1 type II toxin-antitoxin system RelE/ParE family toxin [Bacteroidales bacterium]
MYRVKLSAEAVKDIDEYIGHIHYTYDAPLTAIKHYAGLTKAINSLRRFPSRHSIQTGASFFRYGVNVRRINYKKMAIIYTVSGDTVYIHRVVPSSLITSI